MDNKGAVIRNNRAVGRTTRSGLAEPQNDQDQAVAEQAASSQAETMMLDVLDKTGRAALLIDPQGVVRGLNGRAAALLDQITDGLLLTSGRLRAAYPGDNRRLQALITTAISSKDDAEQPGSIVPIVIERPGRRSLLIEALSVRGPDDLYFKTIASILLITDPENASFPPNHRLRAVFGFTEAEAKLAVALARGKSLRNTALENSISYATARTQLKAVFDKARVQRQGELVALLACMTHTN